MKLPGARSSAERPSAFWSNIVNVSDARIRRDTSSAEQPTTTTNHR